MTKAGWVYFGESKRKNGMKMEYVGSTTRSVSTREGEHKKEVRKKNSRTWVGRGASYKTTGKMWSANPRKAEKTIKQKKKSQYKSGTYKGKYYSHNSNLGKTKKSNSR